MSRVSVMLRLVLVPGVLPVLGACSDQGPAPAPSTVAAVSGNNQTGLAGQPLSQPLVVQVAASSGDGVANVVVTWTVAEGGGSLSATTVATDREGQAVVMLGRWQYATPATSEDRPSGPFPVAGEFIRLEPQAERAAGGLP